MRDELFFKLHSMDKAMVERLANCKEHSEERNRVLAGWKREKGLTIGRHREELRSRGFALERESEKLLNEYTHLRESAKAQGLTDLERVPGCRPWSKIHAEMSAIETKRKDIRDEIALCNRRQANIC